MISYFRVQEYFRGGGGVSFFDFWYDVFIWAKYFRGKLLEGNYLGNDMPAQQLECH